MKNYLLKYLLILAILSVMTVIQWRLFDFSLTGIDDANIFFVYAKNFANGHGFVYNVGGERVEGFSSILWTLIGSAAFYLFNQPELAFLIFNLLVVTFGIMVAVNTVQTDLLNPAAGARVKLGWASLLVIVILTTSGYVTWNVLTLMENGLWSTLLLLLTIAVTRKEPFSTKNLVIVTLLLVIALLTRPEAYLWAAVFGGIWLLRRFYVDGFIQATKSTLPILVAAVVTVSSLTLFRLSYFGHPLPNTYYAKVSSSITYNFWAGLTYFKDYLISNPVTSVMILAVAVGCVRTIFLFLRRHSLRDGRLFLPLIAGVGLAIPLITGGDHFSEFRFYQNIYPIIVLNFIYLVNLFDLNLEDRLSNLAESRRWVYPVVGLIAAGFLLNQAFFIYKGSGWFGMGFDMRLAAEGRDLGRLADETFAGLESYPSLGVVPAGGIKYTYPGEVIDLMGLNNSLMAHNDGDRKGVKNHAAFEKATFYQLEPDIVSLIAVDAEEWEYDRSRLKNSWWNLEPLKGIYNDEQFLELYSYAKIERRDEIRTKAMAAWVRQDYLSELESTGLFKIEIFAYAPD